MAVPHVSYHFDEGAGGPFLTIQKIKCNRVKIGERTFPISTYSAMTGLLFRVSHQGVKHFRDKETKCRVTIQDPRGKEGNITYYTNPAEYYRVNHPDAKERDVKKFLQSPSAVAWENKRNQIALDPDGHIFQCEERVRKSSEWKPELVAAEEVDAPEVAVEAA